MSRLIFKYAETPGKKMRDIAAREKRVRKARGLTQEELAKEAAVSLGSLRRFEQTGEISLRSLIAIAFALGCEGDLDALFGKPAYRSIQEVVDDKKRQH